MEWKHHTSQMMWTFYRNDNHNTSLITIRMWSKMFSTPNMRGTLCHRFNWATQGPGNLTRPSLVIKRESILNVFILRAINFRATCKSKSGHDILYLWKFKNDLSETRAQYAPQTVEKWVYCWTCVQSRKCLLGRVYFHRSTRKLVQTFDEPSMQNRRKCESINNRMRVLLNVLKG